MKILRRSVLLTALTIAAVGLAFLSCFVRMPGRSYTGRPGEPSPAARDEAERLRAHVEVLAGRIGERHLGRPESLQQAADYVRTELEALGYEVVAQTYPVRGTSVANLEASIQGTERPSEVVVVGAHYDSAIGTPGANDNATGVAVLLELARMLAGSEPERTIRLVAFVNEEPPWFRTEDMGSVHHAAWCEARGDDVTAMLSLETMGYYVDEPHSQHYPSALAPFYPDRGDFLAFVGNVRSVALVRRCVEVFRAHATLPSEGGAAPAGIPGVGFSDHWSYWRRGWDAVMVTDTAFNRYPHYHEPTDTPEKIDYERLSAATRGVLAVVEDLASPPRG